MTIWQATTDAFAAAMARASTRRAFVVRHDERLRVSHPFLDDVAAALEGDTRDYHAHRGAFFEVGSESGHLLSAFIHDTRRGQAAGGVRFWPYPTVEAWVRDGLRLSRGMGHKNALAGLWWGGGKGVIARQPGDDHLDPARRGAIYRDYGRFITGLRGCYVTAEDAGTTAVDMEHVFATTRHTTCIPPRLGGSGNPSVLTARGVVVAMEAALHAGGRDSLVGATIVSKGVGNVARHMLGPLLERGVKRIVGVDIDARALDLARRMHADERVELRQVERGDDSVFDLPCDVFAPNAVGGSLNPTTIPRIHADVVCGAANNQLEDPDRDAHALAERGVVYVPDFVANRMGIVNCANEQYGSFEGDPAIQHHLDRDSPSGIFQRTLEVLRRAQASGRSPAHEAVVLAETLLREPHPIWGDRARTIVDALVRDGWAHASPIADRPLA